MQVTCWLCKKKIEKDTAYKHEYIAPKNGKKSNRYYCSEQEYIDEKMRIEKYKADKDKVYYFICEMFGYEIQNTKFFDEWAHWNKLKSNEIIYEYLVENEALLRQVCDKDHENEYKKIRHFSAFLKNNLKDFKPKLKVVENAKVVVDETIYEAPTQSLNKRRSLEDLEEMF